MWTNPNFRYWPIFMIFTEEIFGNFDCFFFQSSVAAYKYWFVIYIVAAQLYLCETQRQVSSGPSRAAAEDARKKCNSCEFFLDISMETLIYLERLSNTMCIGLLVRLFR